MDRKQGKEKFEIVKDENKQKRNYVFQKNTKTKIGFVFILSVLVVLILAVAMTNLFI